MQANNANTGPPAVQAALSYLDYVRAMVTPKIIATASGPQMEPARQLDVLELRSRDAALGLLRAYFSAAGSLVAQHEVEAVEPARSQEN